MKKFFKGFLAIICSVLFIISAATTVFAHSGRTDSSGGHKDNKNKSGLGSYHYHCGGYPAHLHTNGYCPYRDVFPSSVSMKTENTTLRLGDTASISADVYPSNSCNTKVSWSSSDPSIISISNGTITAKKYGTATIYAETFNGVTGSVTITVKEIVAEKVEISGLPQADYFYINDNIDLTSQITPENVDNPSIVWASSNPDVASVSTTGTVTLMAEGTTEITATAKNGVSGKVIIAVKEKQVEAVDIEEDTVDIFLGKTHTVAVSVTPQDATYPELTWSVDDPSILSVSEAGIITTLACGEAIVTATAANGLSDSVVVNVNEVVATALDIEGPDTLLLGDTASFDAIFTPNNTTDQQISWAVDDATVASISNDGILTAHKLGQVVITATQKDVDTTHTVEILPISVERVNISANITGDISKNDTINFTAQVFPENATYQEITWDINNADIASISENGILTALKNGTVIVTATSADGIKSEYEVTISSSTNPLLGISGAAAVGVIAIATRKKRNEFITPDNYLLHLSSSPNNNLSCTLY